MSPDGTKVAYKKLGNRGPGDWRLAVLDLATGKEMSLAEQHSVDDQVEWLDDDQHPLRPARARAARPPRPTCGSCLPTAPGARRVLIAKAWSPAVVR